MQTYADKLQNTTEVQKYIDLFFTSNRSCSKHIETLCVKGRLVLALSTDIFTRQQAEPDILPKLHTSLVRAHVPRIFFSSLESLHEQGYYRVRQLSSLVINFVQSSGI